MCESRNMESREKANSKRCKSAKGRQWNSALASLIKYKRTVGYMARGFCDRYRFQRER
jgi:hypothetical protein